MKFAVRLFITFLFCIHVLFGYSQTGSSFVLWYKTPAGTVWENALPIGNGRLGAMVYGNVDTEKIALNEHTVWSGGPDRNDNPEALHSLAAIRNLIFTGKRKEAEQLANKTIISPASQGQMFEPVGCLQLAFGTDKKVTQYRRQLDISTAVQTTTYTQNGITFTREVLASFPKRVIAVHLRANKENSLSFQAFFSTVQPHITTSVGPDTCLLLAGRTVDHEGVAGKVKFAAMVKIKLKGGKQQANDSSLYVTGASEATIYVSVATNFNRYDDVSGDEMARAKAFMQQACNTSFNDLRNENISAYQSYFNRVALDLGKDRFANLPTDERLQTFHQTADPHFAALYFQYGRYLLISSSQPGGQPANLQGIWNNQLYPPWDSKYTININAEMNYWPAEKTNLAELHEPFLQMVNELSQTGQKTASDMYGAKGWMAHHNTDIWRTTGAVDGAFWGVWNNGGGWMSQHLWKHFLYSGDTAYLSSVYPVLKGAAAFYASFLTEHPVYHWLVVCPDMSPENAPQAHAGSSIDAGVTMTNQIVFDAFKAVIRASEILGEDQPFADSLQTLCSRLPPMHIGKFGQLQEWLDDVDDPNDHHRHISHLYGLFPSNQISPYRTPALFGAARTTLLQRGDVSTGWSMGWKVNWWAKMLDGNHAFELIKSQLTPVGKNKEGGGTYNNLFDAHPPFQIDGNFGCTSGMAEMLMQSDDEAVFLLPALPDAWQKEGSISGLRALGGFEIAALQWKNGEVVKVSVKSNLGGNLRIRSFTALLNEEGKNLPPAKGNNPNRFYYVPATPDPIVSAAAEKKVNIARDTYEYDVVTEAGQTYTFYKK